MMKELRISRLDYTAQALVFTFDPETPVNPIMLVAWAQQDQRLRLLPGDKLSFQVRGTDPDSRIVQCYTLLENLKKKIEQKDSRSLKSNFEEEQYPRYEHRAASFKRHKPLTTVRKTKQ